MMAAMMFPSIWPMVVMYSRIQRGKRERGQEAPAGATALFVAGYLVTWTAAGLVAYAVFEAARSLSIDALSWDRGGPYLAGGVIVARGAIYQLTPLKDVCLSKCRNPLMFVLTSWQPGRLGALRMGIEHGAWCVGCCWALMAALFALGVMSVGWMVFIAALIAIEKLLPWKAGREPRDRDPAARRSDCRSRSCPRSSRPHRSPTPPRRRGRWRGWGWTKGG